MRRLSVLCAAGLAVTVLAASPANASPYHLIRWLDTGVCQIWDDGIPTRPMMMNYQVVSPPVPTFLDAMAFKGNMLRAGACSF